MPDCLKTALRGYLVIIPIVMTTSPGCLVQTSVDVPTSSSSSIQTSANSCTYRDQVTYPLAVNPAADFSVNAVLASHQVTSSTCSGLPAGSTETQSVDSISLSNNTVTVTDNGYYDTLAVSGTSLTHPAFSGCVQGVSITGSLVSGSLNGSAETMVLLFQWNLLNNNCTGGYGNLNGTPGTPPSQGTEPPAPPANDPPPADPLATEPDNNTSHNLIYFNSQAGDYIGGGLARTYQPAAGDTFTATKNYDNGVSITYHDPAYNHWWYLDFASGDNSLLVPGTYDHAERYAFKSPGAPGIDIYGDGRGCNTISGKFTVLDIAYGSGTDITRFWVEFEQHCEGGGPALYGTVRFNAGPPAP